MAITVKQLIPAQYAQNSTTTEYTATNCKAIIDKFTATNISSANLTFSVYVIPSGGSASNDEKIIDDQTVLVGQCYKCPELVGHVVDVNGFIAVVCSDASALTIFSSGREIT